MEYLWFGILAGLAIIGVLLALRWRHLAARYSERSRAIREFASRRQSLAALLLEVAGSSGKPRGLRWIATELSGPVHFAASATGDVLHALVGVTIRFEAIPGGGMEEVEAVSDLRSATAVFLFRDGEWTTDGRVIFNLEPADALQKFHETMRPLNADDF